MDRPELWLSLGSLVEIEIDLSDNYIVDSLTASYTIRFFLHDSYFLLVLKSPGSTQQCAFRTISATCSMSPFFLAISFIHAIKMRPLIVYLSDGTENCSWYIITSIYNPLYPVLYWKIYEQATFISRLLVFFILL